MADLDIQRKKASPSPWLLVALALALLAGAAWYFLRPAPADDEAPAAPAAAETATPADTLAADTLAAYPSAAEARATPPPADAAPGVAQPAAEAASEASATRAELLALVGTLAELADRPDLRADAAVREQRDNLTSATARLADGSPTAGLALDTLAAYPAAADARATPPPADAALGAAPADAAASDAGAAAAAPTSTTRAELLALVGTLADLADRPDLRADATVREQRDNLTSATARLADGAAGAGLRPGLVGVAAYLRTIQQRGYPALETDALALQTQAAALSGRDATTAEQAQNQEFIAKATALADALSAPPR